MTDFNFEKYIDISPLISSKSAIFPGDIPFQNPFSMTFERGDNLALSSMQSTVHIGAHADAPSHFIENGDSIDKVSLIPYMGPCQVVHLPSLEKGERISPKHLEKVEIKTQRILFRTDSFDTNQWSDDFNSLSPELLEELHKKNVILVGIDTPSLDPASSKALESHQCLGKLKQSVLENLLLRHVCEGTYTLIALPLKIKGAEASPLRAILI